MIKYWQANSTQMMQLTRQHAYMVLTSLIIALVLALVIIGIFLRKKNWLNGLVYFFSLLYSVPSYAFFALLIPITGLGETTAIIVLTFYSEYILLRSFITGIKEIDSNYLEVAKGLGMKEKEIFFKVQLPLAVPAIFSGMQVALASTMAMATIASTVNAGGLGDLLFEGLQTSKIVPILWGTILTVALTIVFIVMLKLIENIVISDGLIKKRE